VFARFMLMDKRDRLRIIRKHVGKAQTILARFIESTASGKEVTAPEKLVDDLKLHLGHRELVRALNKSPTGKSKVEQADGKSKLRAKNEQAT
jgi:hypothetical protein